MFKAASSRLKFGHFLPVFTCHRLGLLYVWQYFLQHIALQRSRSSLERLSVRRRRWSVMQRWSSWTSTTAHFPLISCSPPAHLLLTSPPSHSLQKWSNFKRPEDPLNLVQIKNPFGSFQCNPQAYAWWVPPFFLMKILNLETPYCTYDSENSKTENSIGF